MSQIAEKLYKLNTFAASGTDMAASNGQSGVLGIAAG
jgi:hypothetical protein